MKEVLFYRNFKSFTGGQLKVWDYFNHVLHVPNYVPKICFSRDSIWDESNPWSGLQRYVVDSGTLTCPDILFLGGLDWLNLPEEQRESSPTPIINLIQHVRHAWPSDPRYLFLRHRAIRICCSEQVAAALRATGRVEGPLFTIPYGLDLQCLPEPIPFVEKDLDLLIVANKQPTLGRLLRWCLWRPGRQVQVLTKPRLRSEFLRRLNRARIAVFLPNPAEGFYLPALEGMALGAVVVCPDCIGNRSFCLPPWNCFRPDYNRKAILTSAEAAWQLLPSDSNRFLVNARQTVAQHDLVKERKDFLKILENVDQLWRA